MIFQDMLDMGLYYAIIIVSDKRVLTQSQFVYFNFNRLANFFKTLAPAKIQQIYHLR